jgi:hypothetical protein
VLRKGGFEGLDGVVRRVGCVASEHVAVVWFHQANGAEERESVSG